MRKIKGFTLVEILVGLVIIAIVAVGTFEFFQYCQRYIMNSDLNLIALNRARETMEDIYWEPFPANEGPGPLVLTPTRNGQRQVRIDPNGQVDPQFEVIEVRVWW